ncbi:hypothetical protein BBK36DRAFT_158387 [Trichoderma citrinoviride]|uniref:Uncharacterized protein n=1 Tax=Trichoderma citrinoviride TaxID=58853 RepID=A0A2T4BDG3_9HYPO|nr:hypothetical protein BBK36DRAFT_158387 [Trichoderma citrinoviride]PTB67355.1 hypothetical protein BBK36DRAFT_158387 [Trichoderma citrinoviride]
MPRRRKPGLQPASASFNLRWHSIADPNTPSVDIMSSPDPLNEPTIISFPTTTTAAAANNSLAPDPKTQPASRRVSHSQPNHRLLSPASPRKQTLNVQAGEPASPQRSLALVQTEGHGDGGPSDTMASTPNGARRKLFKSPVSSPSTVRRRAGETVTTTVPLRETGEDELTTATTPSRRRGRPRMSNGTPNPVAGIKRRAGSPISRNPRRIRTDKFGGGGSTIQLHPDDGKENFHATPATSKKRGRPPKTQASQPSSELGAAKRGRRRQAMAPDELVGIAEEATAERSQVQSGRRTSESDAVDLIPPPSSRQGPDNDDNEATPRAAGQSSTRQRPSKSNHDSRAPEASDHSTVDEHIDDFSSQTNDTIAQGEDFSMIFMNGIPSLQGSRNGNSSFQPVGDDDEVGEETQLFINNTLESLRREVAQTSDPVEITEQIEIPEEPEIEDQPEPEPVFVPIIRESARNARLSLSPWWSRKPKKMGTSPLRHQTLRSAAKRSGRLFRFDQHEREDEPTPTRAGKQPSSAQSRRERSNYQDSFSDIPRNYLDAAAPKPLNFAATQSDRRVDLGEYGLQREDEHAEEEQIQEHHAEEHPEEEHAEEEHVKEEHVEEEHIEEHIEEEHVEEEHVEEEHVEEEHVEEEHIEEEPAQYTETHADDDIEEAADKAPEQGFFATQRYNRAFLAPGRFAVPDTSSPVRHIEDEESDHEEHGHEEHGHEEHGHEEHGHEEHGHEEHGHEESEHEEHGLEEHGHEVYTHEEHGKHGDYGGHEDHPEFDDHYQEGQEEHEEHRDFLEHEEPGQEEELEEEQEQEQDMELVHDEGEREEDSAHHEGQEEEMEEYDEEVEAEAHKQQEWEEEEEEEEHEEHEEHEEALEGYTEQQGSEEQHEFEEHGVHEEYAEHEGFGEHEELQVRGGGLNQHDEHDEFEEHEEMEDDEEQEEAEHYEHHNEGHDEEQEEVEHHEHHEEHEQEEVEQYAHHNEEHEEMQDDEEQEEVERYEHHEEQGEMQDAEHDEFEEHEEMQEDEEQEVEHYEHHEEHGEQEEVDRHEHHEEHDELEGNGQHERYEQREERKIHPYEASSRWRTNFPALRQPENKENHVDREMRSDYQQQPEQLEPTPEREVQPVEATPPHQMSSPLQDPQSVPPQDHVQYPILRPVLSSIMRAGRVLQTVTSDPPSPREREKQLRSPFRSSASKEPSHSATEGSQPPPSKSPPQAFRFGRDQSTANGVTADQRRNARSGLFGTGFSSARPILGSARPTLDASAREALNRKRPPSRESVASSLGNTPPSGGTTNLFATERPINSGFRGNNPLTQPSRFSGIGSSHQPLPLVQVDGAGEEPDRAEEEDDDDRGQVQDEEQAQGEEEHQGHQEQRKQQQGKQQEEHNEEEEDDEDDDDDDDIDLWEYEAQREVPPRPVLQQPLMPLTQDRNTGPSLTSSWRDAQKVPTAVTSSALPNTSRTKQTVDEGQSDMDAEDEEPPLLSQEQAEHAPATASKSKRFDLSSFFSSPATIPGLLAGKFKSIKPKASAERINQQAAVQQEEPSTIPTTSLFPRLTGKLDRTAPPSSSIPSDPPEDEQVDEGASSPATPERRGLLTIAQKQNFAPRPRQANDSSFFQTSSSQLSTSPTRMQLTHEDIQRWQLETSNVVDDSPSLKPLLRPLPPRHASPKKSNLRSPLKPHTPGRVVEFTGSVLSPEEQARLREQRLRANGEVFRDNISTAAAVPNHVQPRAGKGSIPKPQPQQQKQNPLPALAPRIIKPAGVTKKPPVRKHRRREPPSQTVWTRQHWIFLDTLLQMRRQRPFSERYPPVSQRYLGKVVTSMGESLVLEKWHLECVDAFKSQIKGWDEGELAKRLFALILGEAQRRRSSLGQSPGVMFH